MAKKHLFIVLLMISLLAYGQLEKQRNIAWFMPAANTEINGLAVGPMINSFKNDGDSLNTIVNGLSIEVVGVGFFSPLTPSEPLFTEPDSVYRDNLLLDSILQTYRSANYRINGLVLSGGGVVGHDISINGLNVSGIGTLTSKMNGVSLSLYMNYSAIMNGVSIVALSNGTIQTNGLQVGLFNHTKRLRGVQIGLWNINKKRQLPLVNWNFK